MKIRILSAVFITVLAIADISSAQSGTSCLQEVTAGYSCPCGGWPACSPEEYGSIPACPGGGCTKCYLDNSLCVRCYRQVYACSVPPTPTYDETAPGCDDTCGAGEPINLATGNTYIKQTDLRVPGLGGGLTLTRTWNSKWPSSQSSSSTGLFGLNWRSTYEERVFMGSDGTLKWSRGDGSYWSFRYVYGLPFQVIAPSTGGATLAIDGANWKLTFKSGEQKLFDKISGWLVAIVDRNGNRTQLTYDSLNRLIEVTDPASRHLYFAYADSSSYLVTAVTSDVGISLSYSYDENGRLTVVRKPDNSTLAFEYDPQSLITAVRDSDGKILESHVYDSAARGLTSSRADGIEALTITYPQ